MTHRIALPLLRGTPAAPSPWPVLALLLVTWPLAFGAVHALGLHAPLSLGDSGAAGLLLAWLVAPVLEEAGLRLLLQQGLGQALRRRGQTAATAARWAALAATLAFALAHAPPVDLPALALCAAWLLPGAALALCWQRGARLLHCVALHAYFNAVLWVLSA